MPKNDKQIGIEGVGREVVLGSRRKRKRSGSLRGTVDGRLSVREHRGSGHMKREQLWFESFERG